jgi:hypothetical protein
MAREKITKAARTDARSKARRATKQTSARLRRARPPATAPAQGDLAALTHTQLTERYNALVGAALALGITSVERSRVRVHTSAFLTKDLGVRITAALEAAVAAAQAAKPAAGDAPRPRRRRKG